MMTFLLNSKVLNLGEIKYKHECTLEFGKTNSHILPSSAWLFPLFSVLSLVDVRKRIGKEKSFTTKLDWTIISGEVAQIIGKLLIYVCVSVYPHNIHMKYWCNKRKCSCWETVQIWAGIWIFCKVTNPMEKVKKKGNYT